MISGYLFKLTALAQQVADGKRPDANANGGQSYSL